MKLAKHIGTLVFTVTSVISLVILFMALAYTVTHIKEYYYFFGGMALFALLTKFVFKNIGFYQTFSHELTHTLVGLLFGCRIEAFNATRQEGGHIKYYGKSNIFISITPYSLPIFALLLLLVEQLLGVENQFFNAFVGFVFAFHLSCFIKQTRPSQPDITSVGLYRAIVFIVTVLPLSTALCLYAIDRGLFKAFYAIYYDMLYVSHLLFS